MKKPCLGWCEKDIEWNGRAEERMCPECRQKKYGRLLTMGVIGYSPGRRVLDGGRVVRKKVPQ